MAGLPGLSLPCGFVSGLPVGLQLIGKPYDEETLFRAAYTYEQATDGTDSGLLSKTGHYPPKRPFTSVSVYEGLSQSVAILQAFVNKRRDQMNEASFTGCLLGVAVGCVGPAGRSLSAGTYSAGVR